MQIVLIGVTLLQSGFGLGIPGLATALAVVCGVNLGLGEQLTSRTRHVVTELGE